MVLPLHEQNYLHLGFSPFLRAINPVAFQRMSGLLIAVLAMDVLARDFSDWWINQGCEARLGSWSVNKLVQEAVETARRVVQRLDAGAE